MLLLLYATHASQLVKGFDYPPPITGCPTRNGVVAVLTLPTAVFKRLDRILRSDGFVRFPHEPLAPL
jgi:hypothetical protein